MNSKRGDPRIGTHKNLFTGIKQKICELGGLIPRRASFRRRCRGLTDLARRCWMSRASSKRSRSWEVDVSLDELAEWEALDLFMPQLGDGGSAESVVAAARGSCSGATQCDAGLGASHPAAGRSTHAAQAAAAALSAAQGRYAAAGSNTIPLFSNFASTSSSTGASAPALASACDNAAALAQSLSASWRQPHQQQHQHQQLQHHHQQRLQQHTAAAHAAGPSLAQMPKLQALPMERGVSWGGELLPFVMDDGDGLMDPSMLDGDGGAGGGGIDGGMDGMAEESSTGKGGGHKARFVWTGELHRRFEAAVNTLGIDQAKPQTISQLMKCEGEGAPTRQNIKSHLQKYRLLMQKRSTGHDPADVVGGSSGASEGATGNAGSVPAVDADVHKELEQHLEKQEMNLRMQMELQTKLHRQLLVQRQLQHQLEHCFPSTGDMACQDRQRYQATVSLKNSLRERLTKHVMVQQVRVALTDASCPPACHGGSRYSCGMRVRALQQEMLQHLDKLVSNEASKHEAADEGGH